MSILRIRFCLILSLFLLQATVASAERVIVVFDASGSMWGQIGSEPKLAIAKRVVGGLLQQWDADTEIGLVAYGHRRDGDCRDIETVVPVAKLDAAAFSKTVNGLNAKGKTPLTAAVRKAAEELRYKDEKATVILVSDGVETCDEDPCAVAKSLEASGVDFTAHVVGFDVSKPEELKQLECIATNTGGKFLSASDGATLAASLDTVAQEVQQVATTLRLKAVHEPGGKAIEDVRFEVLAMSDGSSSGSKLVRYGGGHTPEYRVEPGLYTVRAISNRGEARREKEVTVAQDAVTDEELVFPLEGKIQLVAVTAPGGEPVDDVRWELFEAAVDDMSKPKLIKYGGGAQPTYQLLPGQYRARVTSQKGQAVAEREVEVRGGALNRAEVVLSEEGEIHLVAVTEPGGKPVNEVRWELFTIEGDAMRRPELVKFGGGNSPTYRLLPGKYQARATSLKGKAVAESEVEVQAGRRVTAEVAFPKEGEVQLVAVNEAGGKPLSEVSWQLFTLVEPNSLEKPELVQYGKGGEPRYRVLPGRYRAEVKSNRGVAVVSAEVEVRPGELTRAEVLFPQEGIVQLVAVREPGGTPLKQVNWELFTIESDPLRSAELIKYGGGSEPKFQVLPGKYLAKLRLRGVRETIEREVVAEAGKLNRLEVVLGAEG